jgi:glycosyltransferase involved in cell wall biosynthesis
MNVLMVVEPGVDGVFRHVEGLCRFLFQKGVTIHLAYSSRRGSENLGALVESVHGHGGETMDMKVGNAPCLADAGAFGRLRSLARKVKPEVIHAHSSKAGVLGRALRLTGVHARYFYTAHAYFGMRGTGSLTTSFFNSIEMIFGRIGGTINISDDELAFATKKLRIPRERIHVIHNPVDTDIFRPATETMKQMIRSRFHIPDDALLLGSVGRLSLQKDPKTMYTAVAEAMAKHPNLWLCHVGSGEMEGELDALATRLKMRDRLVHIAYLNSPAEIYRAFDAFIVTPRYEAGWPLVVLEALASNLPVIVAACPGASNMSNGGLSHCWTAEPGNAKSVAEAIEAWATDVPNARTVNHRQIAEERFSVEALFGAVHRLYLDGVNPHSSDGKTSGT